jgi:uncharacterized membrane-anchored protein YhcB (DUF1043 family)
MVTFLLGALFSTCLIGVIFFGVLTLKLKKEQSKLKKQVQTALSDCRNDDLLIHKRIDGEIDRTNEMIKTLSKELIKLRTEVEIIAEPEIDSSVKVKKKKKRIL